MCVCVCACVCVRVCVCLFVCLFHLFKHGLKILALSRLAVFQQVRNSEQKYIFTESNTNQ